MSWLYRFFHKSDNEQVVTIAAPYVQITGVATVTGAQTFTGNQTVTGNETVTGRVLGAWLGVTNTATITTITATTITAGGLTTSAYATVTNVATAGGFRAWTGPIFLGSGTRAIIWGAITVDPINDGVAGVGGATGYDKGSLFIGGTSGLYTKTDYASTAWASVDLYD